MQYSRSKKLIQANASDQTRQIASAENCDPPCNTPPRQFIPCRETYFDEFCGKCGAPGRIRTPNLLIRSQTLYPVELRALCVRSASARKAVLAVRAGWYRTRSGLARGKSTRPGPRRRERLGRRGIERESNALSGLSLVKPSSTIPTVCTGLGRRPPIWRGPLTRGNATRIEPSRPAAGSESKGANA